ncbi:MAG TPA: hypothetical protein ENH23_05270, partial [candidate division Zixibacteria bacterium]|nr:hypothetical protein [candidate division Zixibacteria bacterium]
MDRHWRLTKKIHASLYKYTYSRFTSFIIFEPQYETDYVSRMNTNTTETTAFDLFKEPVEGKIIFASDGFKRVEHHINESCSKLVDIHSKSGVQIHCLRISAGDAQDRINIIGSGEVAHVSQSNEFGILLRINNEQSPYTIWLPAAPGIFSFDEHQRIASTHELNYKWDFYPRVQLSILQTVPLGEVAVVSYVVIEDPHGEFFTELESLSEVEHRLYRKSDWFFARTPSDLWNYLINGNLYDPRALPYNPYNRKGTNKRIKCQQCAYSWWSYFGYLHRETGKKIYDAMQNEVAYSVLMDMDDDGGWRHGHWSDEMETHARFQLDGIHLLISQYEKTGESMWLEAAERGMSFVSEHLMEQLDDGSIWYLHDTIEHEGIHRLKSKIFGKTLGNSLCINTHVQALTVVYRLCSLLSDKPIYGDMFEKGVRALQRVLKYQPGEAFYKMLMPRIMKYKSKGRAQSLKGKIRKGLEWYPIQSIYWLLRWRFPRIAMTGGFTERDLTHSTISDSYHITNVKDFLTLYQQEPMDWLRPYIENGLVFTRRLLKELDLTNAIARSSYYIEFIDILYLYNKLIDQLPFEEIASAEEKIYQETGGYSLDYNASGL